MQNGKYYEELIQDKAGNMKETWKMLKKVICYI